MTVSDLRIAPLTGADLIAALDDVARLRIEVFAGWPYLYDGDLQYERRYLQAYHDSRDAIVVGAYDGAALVGVSTGMPMADHEEDFAAAFAGTGIAIEDVFYCAESVLLPQYQGQGVGHAFFDAREDHARALGFAKSAFCSVIRPADHPARPKSTRSLEPFWRKRGYAPLDGVVAQFGWKDIGAPEETQKPLQFWMREL